MATRSWIALKHQNKYLSVYCHWDGYPEHHGTILKKNFNTEDKVLELLSNGFISSLGDSIAECEFYHRDRGEEISPPNVYPNLDLLKYNFSEEFLYVFEDNRWRCFNSNGNELSLDGY